MNAESAEGRRDGFLFFSAILGCVILSSCAGNNADLAEVYTIYVKDAVTGQPVVGARGNMPAVLERWASSSAGKLKIVEFQEFLLADGYLPYDLRKEQLEDGKVFYLTPGSKSDVKRRLREIRAERGPPAYTH